MTAKKFSAMVYVSHGRLSTLFRVELRPASVPRQGAFPNPLLCLTWCVCQLQRKDLSLLPPHPSTGTAIDTVAHPPPPLPPPPALRLGK